MADLTIYTGASGSAARGMRAVVFTTTLIGYWFFIDADNDLKYKKTTDGGATWGASVVCGVADTDFAYDVWFDKWTPGDTGTLIHLFWFGSTLDAVSYRALDTNGDTFGTQRTVFDGASAVGGRGSFVSGTKTRSGFLYCAYDIDAGAEMGFHRSTDGGATWSASLSATFVEATLDEALLFPASNTGDNNDCWAIYHDDSADALTLKMWDSSAAAQVESATIQTHLAGITDLVHQHGFSGSIRHSDGHLILAAVSEYDTATSDHQVWDINGTGSITALTNITTNIDDHYHPAVFIDQLTDHIYVAFNGLRTGGETMGTATKIYYTKSTDGGTTWSAGSTAYMEAAAGARRQVWAPLMGPRFYVGWSIGTAVEANAINSVAFVSDRRAIITFAEMEVPNAPRRARVYFAEMEVPDAPTTDRRGRIYFVEMEVPNAPRRARLYFAEMEIPDAPGSGRALAQVAAFNIGIGAAGSTVIVTGAGGFTPIAAIFLATNRAEAVDTASAGHSRRILGFAANCVGVIKNRSVGLGDEHAIAVPNQRTGSHNRNDACLIRCSVNGTDNGRARVSSFIPDGCVLTIDTQFTVDMRIIVLFIGGDVTQAQILSVNFPTTGAVPFNQDITGLNFNPTDKASLGILIGQSAGTENGAHSDSDSFFGAFTSPTEQFAWTSGQNHLSPTTTMANRHLKAGQAHANFRNALVDRLDRRGTFLSWIADGVRLRWDEIDGDPVIGYLLVLNGGQWAVTSGSTLDSLSDIVVSGLGTGVPVGGLVLSHLTTESGADAVQAHDALSVGVFGATAQYAVGHYGKNGATTSACATAIEHDSVYVNINEAGTVLGKMVVQSLEANQVTFHMSDADPTPSFFGAIVLGPLGVAGPSPPAPNPERWRSSPRTAPHRASRW